MSKEKTYPFISHKVSESGTTEMMTFHVPESELTHPQIQVIAGDFIRDFNELPDKAKLIVWDKMYNILIENVNLRDLDIDLSNPEDVERFRAMSDKCDTLTNALMAKTTPTDLDLLDRLIEYMESRADADGDSEGIYPNEEMCLLNELESLRDKLTEIKKEKNERRTKS